MRMRAMQWGRMTAKPDGASEVRVGKARPRLIWLARRWLLVWLLGVAVFTGLPWLAPILAAGGHDRAAGAIYLVYRPACHQLPHHSWFLHGPAAAPDWDTVAPFAGLPPGTSPLRAYHRPLRAPGLGYQVAVCQRDVAIYGGLLLASIASALAMRAGRRPTISPRAYALALIPIALDGGSALLGLRDSTPILRTVTGGLFGAATAIFVIAQIQASVDELTVSTIGGADIPEPPQRE